MRGVNRRHHSNDSTASSEYSTPFRRNEALTAASQARRKVRIQDRRWGSWLIPVSWNTLEVQLRFPCGSFFRCDRELCIVGRIKKAGCRFLGQSRKVSEHQGTLSKKRSMWILDSRVAEVLESKSGVDQVFSYRDRCSSFLLLCLRLGFRWLHPFMYSFISRDQGLWDGSELWAKATPLTDGLSE